MTTALLEGPVAKTVIGLMKCQTIIEYDNTTTSNRQIRPFQSYPFIICKGMPVAGAPAISAMYYSLFHHYSNLFTLFLIQAPIHDMSDSTLQVCPGNGFNRD